MKTQNGIAADHASLPRRLPELTGLWKLTLGDPGVTIAVLDGPCDLDHRCLAGATIDQADVLGGTVCEGPAAAHGTHTASIIFGQHGTLVSGVAPRCRGLIVPIFKNNRHGGITPCSQPDLARAIRLAVDQGADIINVSGGQYSDGGTAHPALAEAVRECAERGRLIVAAAGNNGCPCPHVPGALPSVLAVGAMNADGRPMEFSNWGGPYQTNGILAPGVDITGALPGGSVTHRTGTSYATPIVAGLAGLLLSLQRARGQPGDALAVRAAILQSGRGCEYQAVPDCRRLLAGRLNVTGAMSQLFGGSRTMSKQLVQPGIAGDPDPIAPAAFHEGPSSGIAAACAKDDRREPVEEQPRVEAHAAPPGRQFRKPGTAVTPSCACQHTPELVYAIGDLDIDFGTLARLDSLQQNTDGFRRGGRLDVRMPGHLLRRLVGWREFSTVPADRAADEGKGGETSQWIASAGNGDMVFHKPNLHDAQAVIWVLRQDESPVYAIRPNGPYAADAYLELIHFLMEQEGYADDRAVLEREGEPSAIYYPSLDTRDGAEPHRKKDVRGRPVRIVERVAIPGTLDGTVKLYNGSVVPVICPDMRGTRSWSMERLLAFHVGAIAEAGRETEYAAEMRNLGGIAQRFFERARNPGRAPEQRALNFAATQAFRSVQDLRHKFGADVAWELDDISVTPSPMCREESACYDVETAFFDPDNVLRSKVVQAQTFDVSDVVPVMLGEVREYRRR